MATQLTWGQLRAVGANLPDDAPVFLEDGNFDCLPATMVKIYTHKDANRKQLMLFEALELQEEMSPIDAIAFPGPVLGIGFDGIYDFENVVVPSIA